MPSSDLAGVWTYRSFRNDPTPVNGDPQKAIGLIFAEAEFRFEISSEIAFEGVIDWGSGGLDLAGTMKPGNADTPVAFAILAPAGRAPKRKAGNTTTTVAWLTNGRWARRRSPLWSAR
jgi:hypothetical protein